MADRNYAQLQPFTLFGSGTSIADTSIVLSSFADIDGNLLTMANFGTKGFGTLEPSSSTQEEQFSFTGVTQNANGTATLTGVSHVDFLSPYTETSGLEKSHAGGVRMVISNTSGYYGEFANKKNDETIEGKYTYPATEADRPRGSSDTDTAVNEAYVTYGQLTRTAIAGAVDASTTVKGIVQLPTQAQTDAGTAVGSTGAALAVTPNVLRGRRYHDVAAATLGGGVYSMTVSPSISAYVDGDVFLVKAGTANSGAVDLNVNAVGAVDIKKWNWGGLVELTSSDINTGDIFVVTYDSANNAMVLQSRLPKQQISQQNQEIYGSSVVGTDSYAVTLNPVILGPIDGQLVLWKADVANTGACTLNVNGLGAQAIRKNNNVDLSNNDIVAGGIYLVANDIVNGVWRLISSVAQEQVEAIVPYPAVGHSGVSTVQCNSNTTMYIYALVLPMDMPVSTLVANATAVGTTGTLDFVLYTQDGQTKLVDATSNSISGATAFGVSFTAVRLQKGIYWFGVIPNGTADITCSAWTPAVADLRSTSGNARLVGTVTVAAGTAPATFDPTAVTVGNTAVIVRFDT